MKINTFLLLLCTLISACGGSHHMPVGAKLSDEYQQPSGYQAHRDQQRLFGPVAGKIAYTDSGVKESNARVLVLLHGVPTSSWMYRKMIPLLQGDMRVISVDLLGYGSSDKPKNSDDIYANANQARRVQALLAHLGVQKYSLLMHDMGGLVAWELMRMNRQNIENLVVLNTIINQVGFEHPNIDPGFFTRQMVKAYQSSVSSALVLEKTFSNMGLAGEYGLSEQECHGYVAPMREGSADALYAFFTNINDSLFERLEQNRSLFKDYKGRTLVLWGQKDKILTTKQIPILQESLSIEEKNIHLYPDNAHFLAEEIPEELSQRIVAFLK